MTKECIFRAEGLSMQFPGTLALDQVDLTINKGEVLGLIGENGAGKSTLMKIIMGVQAQTSGEMFISGEPYQPGTPKNANELGVGMVFQEQSLVLNLTVGQNIFFGKERTFKCHGFVDWKKMHMEAKEALERIGCGHIDVHKKVSDLSFAQRQMVEIARVFNAVAKGENSNAVILLDEPTSVLSGSEIDLLFAEIDKLKQTGTSFVFVSHRLDEVMTICDRISVFKDGKNAGHVKGEEADEDKLYEMMVGRQSSGEYYKVARQTSPEEEVILEADHLCLRGNFKDVSFKLRKGEVISICGVERSGKEALSNVISGVLKSTGGTLKVSGEVMDFKAPYVALDKGIISIPKERREEGIIAIASVMDNMILSNVASVTDRFMISTRKQVTHAKEWIRKLNTKCSSCREEVGKLSGGNAQKVVFSRVLTTEAKILVLDHPTRGVDIGAKEEIYSIIRDLTDEGYGIVLLGDTLDESINLANHILVMKDGLVTRTYKAEAGSKPSQVDIVKYMM